MKIKKLIVATAISLGVACSPAHASELTTLDVMAMQDDSRLIKTIICNKFGSYAEATQRDKFNGKSYSDAKDEAKRSAVNMSGARGAFLSGTVDMVYKNDFSSDVVVGVVELMCHDLYENLEE